MAGHEHSEAAARSRLDDPDASVRSGVLGALTRMGRLTASDVEVAVSDSSPVVRRRAADVAILHPQVSLLALLADCDPSVIEQAAWAAGERTTAADGVVEALCQLVKHPDVLCREAAVAALGAVGDPVGLASVLSALADKATVRRRAVIALAAFEGPEVDAALLGAATDRDWQVRQAAEDLLAVEP